MDFEPISYTAQQNYIFFGSFTFNDLRTQTSSYYSIISAKSMVRVY